MNDLPKRGNTGLGDPVAFGSDVPYGKCMYSGMHIVRENMVGRNKNMRPDIYKERDTAGRIKEKTTTGS